MTKGSGPELLMLRGVPPCPLHLRSPVSSFLCPQRPVRQARPRHPATSIRALLVQRVFLLLCPFTARFIPLGYRPHEGRGPARLGRRALRPGNGRRAAWAPRAPREWGKWGRGDEGRLCPRGLQSGHLPRTACFPQAAGTCVRCRVRPASSLGGSSQEASS